MVFTKLVPVAEKTQLVRDESLDRSLRQSQTNLVAAIEANQTRRNLFRRDEHACFVLKLTEQPRERFFRQAGCHKQLFTACEREQLFVVRRSK